MADLTAVVVSAPRLASSTDTVVVKVTSRSGGSLAGSFDMLISPTPAKASGTWAAAQNTAGVLSLLVGPDSPHGEVPDGTSWAFARRGDEEFLAGPFVITGGDTYVPPEGDGDYDGGEVG